MIGAIGVAQEDGVYAYCAVCRAPIYLDEEFQPMSDTLCDSCVKERIAEMNEWIQKIVRVRKSEWRE
jgi:hypothetical protein